MPEPSTAAGVRLERLPLYTWAAAAVVALSILCAALQTTRVRPYLWPAGTGALLESDPDPGLPLRARPPDIHTRFDGPHRVLDVADGGPADRAGIIPGSAVLAIHSAAGDHAADLRPGGTDELRIAAWRALYWTGTTGPVEWTVTDPAAGERTVLIDREPAWRTRDPRWMRRHLGATIQILVFTGCALVLLLMRSYDPRAALSVLALALSAVAGGGPLFGAEQALPPGRAALTILTWIATPLAFPAIALAILYFPTRSALLDRHPLLHAVPLLTVAPMLAAELGTSLYLSGLETARGIAIWNATHPGVYLASFAAALALNVLVVAEGLHRYRTNPSASERRRIRVVVYTGVPGVLAYALKDGLPVAAGVIGMRLPDYPLAVFAILQALILMAGFGLVYALGFARVLGPRVVLRRSLQYALASRTLTVLAAVPVAALAISLVRHRDRTLVEVLTASSGLNLLLVAAAVAAFRYRNRARHWLDQRFFREEYDARRILLSLTERLRSPTDPADLATLVVSRVDEALHPRMVALLAGGVADGRFRCLAAREASPPPLGPDAGLVAMLRWSEDPLEIFADDPRSPAKRLPAGDRAWLQETGAALLVPVIAGDGALVAIILLGERRSEEAYTAEDRTLLAGIAAQLGLGFDVARLRRGAAASTGGEPTRLATPGVRAIAECPKCGRCEDTGVAICPADGSTMAPVPFVPRVLDDRYRIEQLLGRGGMGAVYRARDLRLDRLVAVKIVRAELLGDAEALRRFHREAQIVASLHHPSIVAVYDYGTLPDGGAYLVMELVRGEDLRHLLGREGRIAPERAVRILSAVCSAIEAAHREGVLHRDLKPENILLPDDGGNPKVLDFGVAKVIEDSQDGEGGSARPGTVLTAAGIIIGTPAYMAPEQFTASQSDGRTDVFSLGVIAYEMLTGRLPFGHGPLGDIVLAQSRGVPAMGEVPVPAGAERAIRMALDPDPDRRPPSPQAFGHLLASTVRPA